MRERMSLWLFLALLLGLPACTSDGLGPGTEVDAGDPTADLAVSAVDAASTNGLPAATTAVRVTVMPGDKGQSLVAALGSANSIHMTMYMLTSTEMINALVARAKAGKEVKVILNQNFPSGTSGNPNQSAYTTLTSNGVQVRWSPGTFTYTHSKSIILDNKTVWIMTMNLATSALIENREFLAIDTDPADVAEAEAIFQADWNSQPITTSGKLIVSPYNSRDRMLQMLNAAQKTIDLEGESISDYMIVGALVARAKAGVAVRVVLASGNTFDKQTQAVAQLKAAGIKVVEVSRPDIHSKAFVVDGTIGYVGSINFSTNSLMYNRELGVVLGSDVGVVSRTIATDFAAGRAL
jgi:phosphatidylserine/phosphatidylglycerophosphate/cardiolipin synthase-like enzyme